jgi:hypothetical protein
MWKRALAYLLNWAEDDNVFLVDVWSAISTKMPEEYSSDNETHMTNTLKLLKHCLEEGYLVAGDTFQIGPDLPPGLTPEEEIRWAFAYSDQHGPRFDWRPWDMGSSEAIKKIERDWRAIDEPFSSVTAMYGIVTLVPTLKAKLEYDRLYKELKLDEGEDDD